MPNDFKLLPLTLEEYTLDNGLRVVLNPDNAIPVVSIAVYYDVGSRNEREGRTGFAHLFEHMMFQGSENVKKAEHFQFISKVGGTMNGTTNSERTNYFQTLPANIFAPRNEQRRAGRRSLMQSNSIEQPQAL